VRKSKVPVFEKPVIVRPKSTSDLLKLQHGEPQFKKGRETLRVEQDLELRGAGDRGVEDDVDFEVWAESIKEDFETVALTKLRFSPVPYLF